jgi:hypothetical protein
MYLTTCPEGAEVAETQGRAVLDSTDGPIEHAKIYCVRQHWFLLPVAALAPRAGPPLTRASPTPRAKAIAASSMTTGPTAADAPRG